MTEVATTPQTTGKQKLSLVQKFAEKYSIEPARLLDTLKATAFRQRGDIAVSNEQMAALLIVADQYKLNPFTKEIFAFNDKGAIVPVVSVDGWARIINEHPAFDGLEFDYAAEYATMPGGKQCPEWCEVRIFRKDRNRPTVVREYLDEVYQAPRGKDGGFAGPWQTHTKRFLRHKTLIQGARIAFGFAGIYDEDEAQRIVEAQAVQVQQSAAPVEQPRQIEAGRSSRLADIIGATPKAEPVPVAAQVDADGVIQEHMTGGEA